MPKEIELAEHYDTLNTVVEAMLRGETNPTALARQMGMTRAQVLNYMDEWKDIAANNPDIQARAREAVTAMDKHFDLIIKNLWEIVDEEMDNKIKAGALKSIADIEEKRQNALQKAGLYDDSSVATALAEEEKRAEDIKQLLSQTAIKFPQTRTYIMEGLAQIFGRADTIPTGDVLKGEVVELNAS